MRGISGHRDQFFGDRVWLIFTLPLLVLDNAALEIENVLADGVIEVAHPVRFGEKRIIEGGNGNVLEIVGAVFARGAVQVGRADTLHRLDVAVRSVLAATEHQVLE